MCRCHELVRTVLKRLSILFAFLILFWIILLLSLGISSEALVFDRLRRRLRGRRGQSCLPDLFRTELPGPTPLRLLHVSRLETDLVGDWLSDHVNVGAQVLPDVVLRRRGPSHAGHQVVPLRVVVHLHRLQDVLVLLRGLFFILLAL